MRKLLLLLAFAVLAACVTINVYFPAAEAREAAKEFVEEVIGEGDQPVPENGDRGALLSPGQRLVEFFIPSAHAQSANIDIRTPAIQAIQARMVQRFQGQLQAHFDSGALGFTRDGLIVVRDASKLPLNARVTVNQAVAEDNRDRNAVYREIAVANGHPEWEQQIREIFASQWIASARGGWWYQNVSGAWKQK